VIAGGHQRIVPISARFFATLADYLNHEGAVGFAMTVCEQRDCPA
jgi:hypothetical protein